LGKLNSSYCIEIKEEAKNLINIISTEKIKKEIQYIVKDLDSYIDNVIESKLEELKKTKI